MPGRRRPRFRDSLRRPRPDRAQLTRYFVGTEGMGERALARWIESVCMDAGHKMWFHIPGTGSGGGSTFDVVQRTLTNRNRLAKLQKKRRLGSRFKGALLPV
jgi:hypothetical protein